MYAEMMNYIIFGGVALGLVVWYIKIEKPRQSKLDEKREQDNKGLIEYFIKSMREDNANALRAIDQNLIMLTQIINDKKLLDSNQIEIILRNFASNTILKIIIKINMIIDNNSLIENEDAILRELKILIDKYTQESKDSLNVFNLSEHQINQFVDNVRIIKTETFERIKEYFVTTIYNLRTLEEGIERAIQIANKEGNEDNKMVLIESRIKKITTKEQDYKKLKRNINILLEDIEQKIYLEIKKIM